MTIDNNVLSILKAGTNTASSAEPQAGFGFQGEWPPAGPATLVIVGVTEKVGQRFAGKDAPKLPCAHITFRYRSLVDKSNPDSKEIEFDGRPFELLSDSQIASLPADPAWLRSIAQGDWGRFKQHLMAVTTLGKDDIKDVAATFAAVKDMISKKKVVVAANIQWKTRKDKEGKPSAFTDKTEYLVEAISD